MASCSMCGRLFTETAYPAIQVTDFEAADGPDCLECAVQHPKVQYKTPGECMDGITIPEGDDDVRGKFLALCDAVFWAEVWHNRARELGNDESATDESATAKRLDDIEQAFDKGEWNRGARLLSPIGAPAWSSDREARPLYAWEPDNCRRVAEAWIRLRTCRVRQLPEDLQKLVRLPNLEYTSPVAEREHSSPAVSGRNGYASLTTGFNNGDVSMTGFKSGGRIPRKCNRTVPAGGVA